MNFKKKNHSYPTQFLFCWWQLPDHIYIGGYSGDHKISEVTKMSFEGCIDGFQINSQAVDLNKNLNAHGIIPGCPERVSMSV